MPIKHQLKQLWYRTRILYPMALGPPPCNGPVAPPPPFPVLSAAERANLFEHVNPADLFEQLGALDVQSRVYQVLDRWPTADAPSFAALCRRRQSLADGPPFWNSWTVLTWFAWRFAPARYLEVGTSWGRSTALVALNSPGASIVTFDVRRGFDAALGKPRAAFLAGELARCGFARPISFIPGNPRRKLGAYLRGRNRPGLPPTRRRFAEFDLILINGVITRRGAEAVLQSALSHCALGGLVVFQPNAPEPDAPPGPDFPPVCQGRALWERVISRHAGFRDFERPEGLALAFRVR